MAIILGQNLDFQLNQQIFFYKKAESWLTEAFKNYPAVQDNLVH
jgi:hypothetical protein